MMQNGEWNPPDVNYEVGKALSIFRHLANRRHFDVVPMSGHVIYRYLSDVDIQAFLDLNDISENRDMLLPLIYTADELDVKHLNRQNKKNPRKK